MTTASDALVRAAQDALYMAVLRHRDMEEAMAEIEQVQRRADEMREARDAHLVVFKRLGVLPETALESWNGDKLRLRSTAHRMVVELGVMSPASDREGEVTE